MPRIAAPACSSERVFSGTVGISSASAAMLRVQVTLKIRLPPRRNSIEAVRSTATECSLELHARAEEQVRGRPEEAAHKKSIIVHRLTNTERYYEKPGEGAGR